MSGGLPPAGAHVTYSQQYRRCRKVGCALCRNGGKGHGPYWFAYWREDGKVRSRYLGKPTPPGVEETRASVAELQQARAASDQAAPSLRVCTLGGLAVWRNGQPLPATSWRRRKVTTLFACLLSAPGYRLSREALCDVLWPETPPDAATRNLHATIHLLRQVLEPVRGGTRIVQLAGEMVVLEPGSGTPQEWEWLDAAAFARAAGHALAAQDSVRCRDALALYGGDYLPDEPYLDWVVTRRDELRNQYMVLLLHLAALADAAGDYAEAELCYNAVLARDSCHEDAATALMGLLVAQGRRAEALRVYQALAAALENELGLAPSAEVEALRGRVQALETRPAAAGRPPQPPCPDRLGNLPAPLTSFVGREWELPEIAGLLSRPPAEGGRRLMTLVGVGGCGKTRLALAVAESVHAAFPDGVWLVELAAVTTAGQVHGTVMRALGGREEPGGTRATTLSALLRSRRLLLVLDNCEHLAEACADLAAILLRDCPDLHILATSRSPLDLLGEQVWRVPPLGTPPAEPLPDLPTLLRYEAVRLLVERVQDGRRDFVLTQSNAGAIVRICRHLDGLPLAIELAAARLATLPVDVVAARLDDCFALLIGGNRTALPRQRTLRATMDWSYALLSARERLLFQRLSVFSGGCTLEATEATCADAEVPAAALPDLLARLVGQSLVQLDERLDQPRYRLLEILRQYAHTHLVESGVATAVQERHGNWFLAQAERMRAGLVTPDRDQWLRRIEDDLDNVRAALAWSVTRTDDGVTTLRFVDALLPFWLLHGHLSEGRRWGEGALARAEAAQRAKVLNALGALANEQGEGRQAMAYYEESLTLYREVGEMRGIASVLTNLGTVAKYQGDLALARERYEESSRLLRALDDKATLSIVLNNLGALWIDLGQARQARGLLEESLALKRSLGNPLGIAAVLANLAEIARQLGELDQAVALYDQQLDLARAQGDKLAIALALYNLGLIAGVQGQYARAATLFGESLVREHELGNRRHVASCLEGIAAMAGVLGEPATGGRLFGAAAALREEIGTPVLPADRPAYDRDVDLVRAQLGDTAGTMWAAGRAMSLDQAICVAMTLRARWNSLMTCSPASRSC
jgi:predicted ATPase/DNA-binding SARP family transcriptional activator/Tfp pilus assembly protein PilF